jgi:hypothetical protein
MERIAKKTHLSVEQILVKAREFFDGKFGLEVSDELAECCVEFRNDIGFVNVSIERTDDTNEVTLRSKEYEKQAREFIQKL